MQPGKLSSGKGDFLFLLGKKLNTFRKHERNNVQIIVSNDLYVVKPLGAKYYHLSQNKSQDREQGFGVFLN